MDNKEQEYLDTVNYYKSIFKPNPTDRSLQCGMYVMDSRIREMMDKMYKNINNILNNISKMKANGCRKYQISGYHEWKKLKKELCNIPDIRYELVNDKTLTKNKVTEIIAG